MVMVLGGSGTITGATTFSTNATFSGTLGVTGALTQSAALNLTSGQIAFPATQIPSSDANTLDDYEEGTWTPTFGAGSSDPTVTYSEQIGYYIKVGRLITCYLKLGKSSSSGGSGSVLIRGLPFLSHNPGYYMGSRVDSWSWSPASPDYKVDSIQVIGGSTAGYLWDIGTNSIAVSVLNAGGGCWVTGMFSYYTSA